MDPIQIIQKFYKTDSKAYHLLVEHSRAVTKKALEICDRTSELKPDVEFIKEAAMLHDVGIFLTNAADLDCFGDKPYICHGYLGRELMENEGLSRHGRVCESHVGVGISLRDIENQNLPLPKRNMLPITLEEEIVCFADKFYSKNMEGEKSIEKIKSELLKFGVEKVEKFETWMSKFGY